MAESNFSKVVSLQDINNGAFGDLFQIEFKKLLKNLGDENTSWKTQREITMKLKVKLNSEERANATTMVEVKSKLAPLKPNEQIIHLDTDGKDVFAFSRKEVKQPDLDNIVNIEERR